MTSRCSIEQARRLLGLVLRDGRCAVDLLADELADSGPDRLEQLLRVGLERSVGRAPEALIRGELTEEELESVKAWACDVRAQEHEEELRAQASYFAAIAASIAYRGRLTTVREPEVVRAAMDDLGAQTTGIWSDLFREASRRLTR